MPNYVLVNTNARTIELKDFADYRDALKAIGLESGMVDFGSLGAFHDLTIHIMVYEYGLIRPIQTTYFRVAKQLFNGNAIIFASNPEGETVNFPSNIAEHWKSCPEFEWLNSSEEAEEAITSGRATRPQQTINGKIFWQWNKNHHVH